MFHCCEVGDLDADLRRTVGFSWRRMLQRFTFLQADDEVEGFSHFIEADDDVLLGFFSVGGKSAVVSEW